MGCSQRMNAGTSILIDIYLAPLINANDILLKGKAQFITLQISDNENLIIINDYVACSSNKRVLMWKWLNEVNLITNHFILGGDFNHWEEIERKGVATKLRMHRREAATWHHLTLQYGLMDTGKHDNFWKMFARNSPSTTKDSTHVRQSDTKTSFSFPKTWI